MRSCDRVHFNFLFRHQLAGQHVVWFVDNTVALSAFVKGMSGDPTLCFMVMASHLLMLQYNIHSWFEYVPSDDNWADGISRDGWDDLIVKSLLCRRHTIDWSPLFWPKTADELLQVVNSLESSA